MTKTVAALAVCATVAAATVIRRNVKNAARAKRLEALHKEMREDMIRVSTTTLQETGSIGAAMNALNDAAKFWHIVAQTTV